MNAAPLVLHLNGAPGAGKSTLARRWADEHPWTLLLDPDVLRTGVSGWRDDFASTGAAIRPVAIAMVAAYVAEGRNVVLPQLLADPAELTKFRNAAEDAGGRWLTVLVEAPDVAARFGSRPADQPHLAAVHRMVADAPADHLEQYAKSLRELAVASPDMFRLATEDGRVEAAYGALVDVVHEACG